MGVRSAQTPPKLYTEYNSCEAAAHAPYDYGFTEQGPSPREIYDGAVPSWFVGLGIHLLLGAGALFWAWRRTNTPARRLPTGSRIA